jgi:hypothetical protein
MRAGLVAILLDLSIAREGAIRCGDDPGDAATSSCSVPSSP